jgi:adenine-specific DNA-methyltransferase
MSKFLNLTKEELLALVEKQEAELVSKKYGLVWDAEREPEQVVLDCEHYLPVLKRVKGKEIKTVKDQGDNILIEGDNYHALMTLNYTHQGKIDVIYIDPPYNTGAQDWKYNNKFVGEDDGYRHSKWLNLMEKRLNIAKNLMKDDAIICVTIDDYELRTLWMLMDKIFGEENHLGTAVIRNNPSGRKTKRKLALVHEYGLFYGRPKSFIKNLVVDLKNKSHKYVQDVDGTWFSPGNLRKQGIDSQAEKNGKLSHRYFSIYYDPKTGQVSTKKKLSVEILPIDPSGEKRIWRRGSHDIDKMYENGDIWCQQTRNGPQIYYKFRGGVSGEPPKSIWYEPQFSASEHGTRILNNILPTREMFQYPKSLYAVMHSIKIMSSKKDAIILDFFAGSGTTGHAVLELNKEDDGSRKFILCTNNDNSICTDVTYPRLQKVIEGYNFHGTEKTVLFEQKLTYSSLKDIEDILEEINNILENNKNNYDLFEKKLDDGVLKIIGLRKIKSKKEGLSGNLQYFKTDLIKKTKNKDQMRFDLTQKCTDMLCVKENIFNLEVQKEDYKIFSSKTFF